MGLNIELSPQQINGIASYINLKDIQNYIDAHKKEYEQYLKEEQNKQYNKQFKRYTTEKIRDSTNIRKKFKNSPCIIWNVYKEEQKTETKGE